MEEALQFSQAKDTKERMAGVERLHQHLESSTKTLSSSEVTSLVDCCLDLLKDTNFRVSQGALQALASAAVLSGEHLKLHFNALVPAIVERLGDSKQPVRDAARRLLLTLMKVSSPTIILERAGSYAWTHKSWRVREEFARTVSSAISLFASTELPLQRVLLPPVLQLLNDSNNGVREAATLCIEEMYTQVGPQFRDELQHHHLPPFMLKDINARLEKIEPKIRSLDGLTGHFTAMEVKTASLPSFNQKRNSPKAKHTALESSLSGVEFLPSKLHRNYSLMRDLDKSLQVLQRQNEERCEHEIEDIQRGVESGNITPDTSLIRFSDEALDEQKHCIRVSDEKVTLAIKTYDMVDEHIQQLDKFLKKFDEELRREREVTGAAGAAAPGLDGSVKAGRGGDSSKGGRKKSNTPVELPSMDLDLPIDPSEPTYCFCNQVSYGEMVACDNPTCNIEWFHFGCVGLKEHPKGKWYCPNCAGFQKRRKGK